MSKLLLLLPIFGYAITCGQCLDKNTMILENYKMSADNKLIKEYKIQKQLYLDNSDCILLFCEDKKIRLDTLKTRELMRRK